MDLVCWDGDKKLDTSLALGGCKLYLRGFSPAWIEFLNDLKEEAEAGVLLLVLALVVCVFSTLLSYLSVASVLRRSVLAVLVWTPALLMKRVLAVVVWTSASLWLGVCEKFTLLRSVVISVIVGRLLGFFLDCVKVVVWLTTMVKVSVSWRVVVCSGLPVTVLKFATDGAESVLVCLVDLSLRRSVSGTICCLAVLLLWGWCCSILGRNDAWEWDYEVKLIGSLVSRQSSAVLRSWGLVDVVELGSKFALRVWNKRALVVLLAPVASTTVGFALFRWTAKIALWAVSEIRV